MSVEESWTRIIGWLDRHAPATAAQVEPPADPAKIAAVEALFPNSWPADLKSWYALHGGEDMSVLWSGVLPGWTPLSLDGVADSAAMYKEIYADPDLADLAGEPGQAGDPAWTFLPEFVPIADNGAGCALFVDTRPGELNGCVTGFMREDAAVEGTGKYTIVVDTDVYNCAVTVTASTNLNVVATGYGNTGDTINVVTTDPATGDPVDSDFNLYASC